MKNEQENNKDQGKQNTNSAGNQFDKNKQQPGMKPGNDQTGKTGSQSSADKSNISVDNEGRIGKAHDQWNNDNNNRNEQDQRNNSGQGNKQAKSEKAVNDPEIDSPVYDPEKTDKKLPRMEEQKKSNK